MQVRTLRDGVGHGEPAALVHAVSRVADSESWVPRDARCRTRHQLAVQVRWPTVT